MNTSQIITNNKLIDNPEEVSNTFNNFVTNIGPNTEKTIPKYLGNVLHQTSKTELTPTLL